MFFGLYIYITQILGLLEYSIDKSLRAYETINMNMDDLENINSVQNRISFKSSYEDKQL